MDSKRVTTHGFMRLLDSGDVTLYPLTWMILYLNLSLSKYGVILGHNSYKYIHGGYILTYIPFELHT